MDMPYEKPEDFLVLKEYYTEYCIKRFDKLKHLFCDSLGITYEVIEPQEEVVKKVIVSKPVSESGNKKVKFSDKCIIRLVQHLNTDLVKTGRSTYKTQDGKKGYVVTTSKMYTQGNREKYWFAYRRNPLAEISECEEQYVIYGCKDENNLIVLPVSEIEKNIERLNLSKDEDGNMAHWHMVFFKDLEGEISWMLSKPDILEINVTSYVL